MCHVHVRMERAFRVVLHHQSFFGVSYGNAVVRLLRTSLKRHVMLHAQTWLFDDFLEIRVVAQIHNLDVSALGKIPVFIGTHHVVAFIHIRETERAVVVHPQFARTTFLRGDINHTRCTAGTELRGFGGILQDGETLDVGRKDRLEQGQAAHHTIHDDEWVVGSRQRGGTT